MGMTPAGSKWVCQQVHEVDLAVCHATAAGTLLVYRDAFAARDGPAATISALLCAYWGSTSPGQSHRHKLAVTLSVCTAEQRGGMPEGDGDICSLLLVHPV